MYKYCQIIAVFALVLAAGCGSKSVNVNEEFDPTNKGDEEVLVFAVRDGDSAVVEQYLKQYPEIATQRDSTGNTMLHHAAMGGQVGIAKMLLDAGADINAYNRDDLTPLGAAIDRKAEPDMIEFLESKGGVE